MPLMGSSGYTAGMRYLALLLPALVSCITDSGEIEEACDEIAEPCVWEDRDTGGYDTAAEGRHER